jgi:hypothetical protein
MTSDDILARCGTSDASEWVYWVYLRLIGTEAPTGVTGRPQELGPYARAVYLDDPAIGIAWGASGTAQLRAPDWAPGYAAEDRHGVWVDLLYDNELVERFHGLSVAGGQAILPVPMSGRGAGGRLIYWVDQRELVAVRLANEIDPECSDFDDHFERSGIVVR